MSRTRQLPIRNYIRLDTATQSALEEISKHTFSTKSSLMRRYVKEGVSREAKIFADETQRVLRDTSILQAAYKQIYSHSKE